MNSIVVTYPNFQALPKGLKGMLVLSETLFFSQARQPQPRYDGQRFGPELNRKTLSSRPALPLSRLLLEELEFWQNR